MAKSKVGEKAFEFAVQATVLYASAKQKKQYVVADQFFRSATSIGANIREASAAVSRKDFANKMAIASKEARESLYWIEIFQASPDLDLKGESLDELHDRCSEWCRMLTAIVKTVGKRSFNKDP